jgi:single-strand DNA-binding protein
MSYNEVLLMGNLTRDPETKSLPGGGTVCNFGMATNRKWRTTDGEDREDVCFVDCAAFAGTGEVVQNHFAKGSLIFFRGRLRFDSWESDGGKRSKLSVIVEHISFVYDGKRKDDRQQQTSAPARNQPQRSYPQQAQPPRSPQSSPLSNSQQLQARPEDAKTFKPNTDVDFDPNENFDNIPF